MMLSEINKCLKRKETGNIYCFKDSSCPYYEVCEEIKELLEI